MVLDAGAGTGAATAPLVAAGARVVAVDRSAGMLGWRAADRPPSVVADVRALPLGDDAVAAAVAAFVLNHLPDPVRGLAELGRVTRRGGAVLASVFATDFRSALRDRVDAAAADAGWQVPDWYLAMKADTVPLVGDAPAMARAAREAGLDDVAAEQCTVDVGIERAEQLVDYRFGQAPFAAWLDALGVRRAGDVRSAAVAALPARVAYRPRVVVLVARAR
nr:methyltransferase domain-containing protein [Petropleomorpha daqingensis]